MARAAEILHGTVVNVIEIDESYELPDGSDGASELVRLSPDDFVGPGFTRTPDGWAPPAPVEVPPPPPDLQAWAATAQAELTAQRQILDLLLLGGLDDDGGTIDGEIGADLPDSGGTLDDLEGLDLGTLPDSGETLDDLASLEG